MELTITLKVNDFKHAVDLAACVVDLVFFEDNVSHIRDTFSGVPIVSMSVSSDVHTETQLTGREK